MIKLNKNADYLIEYLAKSDDKISSFYQYILDFFKKKYIYSASKYELKTLNVLAARGGVEIVSSHKDALELMEKILNKSINDETKKIKKQLLQTLITSNFKKKKENFDKVDTSIYKCIIAYISSLTRGLELFCLYTKQNPQEPELFIEFASGIHENLISMIFNEQERELLDDKLKKIMAVYLSVYARYV